MAYASEGEWPTVSSCSFRNPAITSSRLVYKHVLPELARADRTVSNAVPNRIVHIGHLDTTIRVYFLHETDVSQSTGDVSVFMPQDCTFLWCFTNAKSGLRCQGGPSHRIAEVARQG